MTVEHKFITSKLMTADDGSIAGIGWKYDQPDRVGDMIAPGAFSKTAWPVACLAFHDLSQPVGAWEAGEDRAGAWHLRGRLLVDDVARAREVYALVKSGAVKGLSVGFITGKAEPRKGGGRLIKSLELVEVSLVVAGMHPGARVTSAKAITSALAIAEVINRAAAHMREGT